MSRDHVAVLTVVMLQCVWSLTDEWINFLLVHETDRDKSVLFSYFQYIYIYIYRFAELDYLVEDIYCYSKFHAPCGAIIRQLLKITDTYEDIQNLKIQNNA